MARYTGTAWRRRGILTYRKNARTELITDMDEMTRFTIQVNGWNYPAKYWVRDRILHVTAATGTRAMPVEGTEPPALLAEKLLRQIIRETLPT